VNNLEKKTYKVSEEEAKEILAAFMDGYNFINENKYAILNK
jgi:hypothetical protein